MSSSIFKHLAEFQGQKYPQFLVDILISTGFDSELSLTQINEDIIKDIENYIDKNKYLIKDTPYENNAGEFKFSIGHKLILRKIPEIIKQLDDTKREVREKVSTAGKGNTRDKIHINSNIQSNINRDINELRVDICTRVKKYANDFNLDFDFCDGNIQNLIKIAGIGYKCNLKCPFCSKSPSCVYKKNWNISNFTSHVKTCNTKGQTGETPGETSGKRSIKENVVIEPRGKQSRVQKINNIDPSNISNLNELVSLISLDFRSYF